jgi:ubiquinone/menaquinone biosynthesis C-methylase UbiE
MPRAGAPGWLDGMKTTAITDTIESITTSRTETLLGRMFEATIASSELLSIELGRRLDLYDTLFDQGAITAPEFAAAAGIAPRYAREWLEQQAAAGIIDVVWPGSADDRQYLLPGDHVPVLVDAESAFNLIGAGGIVAGFAETLGDVVDAYRAGTGVSYDRFGDALREGIAALNRPGFTAGMRSWVETLPDIADRLDAGGVVLDAGCGVGWSTIALAKAFPNAHIVGVDLDEESILRARANARAAGVTASTTFIEANVTDVAAVRSRLHEDYALVTVFEALHDMGEPILALSAFRGVLAHGGAVLVADERVADEFAVPASAVERLNYAASVLHCLPATMAESTAVANGTVLRAPTLRAWAEAAGFAGVVDLPVEHELWRFYRLGGDRPRPTLAS